MKCCDCEGKNNSPIYKICLQGELSPAWANWFFGFEITNERGTTLLTGPIPDQAALHGLLRKILDLGIPILSINAVPRNNIE
jgi:hypothetical protein